MSKEKLNPLTQQPQTRTDLTKDYIKGYIKAHGTEEEKQWYIALVRETPKVERTNQLTKKKYYTDDMKKIRVAVIDKFFPQLKPKPKKKEEKLTYEQELEKEFGL